MMQFIAITQPTASWMLSIATARADISQHIADISTIDELESSAIVLGPLRIAAHSAGVVCLWNVNYLSSTGSESWGFIRTAEPLGILSNERIQNEVFERCLYVISQRLQGLLLETTLFHRAHDVGAHTCLAGRGEEARQLNIGYIEKQLSGRESHNRAVLCVGPARKYEDLANGASAFEVILPKLVGASNEVVGSMVRRAPLSLLKFSKLAGRSWITDSTGSREPEDGWPVQQVPKLRNDESQATVYSAASQLYDEWAAPGSSLTLAQRSILESDTVLRQPMRIAGAAGSGKTLLMQLLAMRRLRAAEKEGRDLRIIYVVHSTAMREMVQSRFETLGAGPYLESDAKQRILVETLFSYSSQELGVDDSAVMDSDAQEAKAFQLLKVHDAMSQVIEDSSVAHGTCPLLWEIKQNPQWHLVFAEIIASEIAVAIKGHGLVDNKTRYVRSEQPLSRLHGVLNEIEREMVFRMFECYHRSVFEQGNILDSDDIALSLLGRLRTPLWSMKRRTVGFDFVFVDETQLFNENERRIIPLLTKGDKDYVPVLLALDEAQELRGNMSAGFGLLGIEKIADANLGTIHRSTRAIIALAFFVIQRTTDLFGPDFPDFTRSAKSVVDEGHKLAEKPYIARASSGPGMVGLCVADQVKQMRKRNVRQIGIVVYSERYWKEVHDSVVAVAGSVKVLSQRGMKIDPDDPVVALARPATVGGQEFDAVILVGLEQGVVPPRVDGHYGFAMSLEQQALREMYLGITRARYQLKIVLASDAAPTSAIQDAMAAGLVDQ